jgi:DNA ligase-1
VVATTGENRLLLRELVSVSNRVAAVSARTEKIRILGEAVALLEPAELAIGVGYLAGVVPQGSFGVGYASLRSLPEPSTAPSLTLGLVDASFTNIAASTGPGSATKRRQEIDRLFALATADEQEFLLALLVEGLRQGANESLMMDAVARATGIPIRIVRRAVMFSGDLGEVAVAAREKGRNAVAGFGLRLFRPIQPMLAKTAASVASALDKTGNAAVDRKLDGARIQVHISGGETRVYTRSLNDVTDRVPEIVAAARALHAGSAVLDGEAIALRAAGSPAPFQVTMARFGSEAEAHPVSLTPFFFDVLHHDGTDVLDLDLSARLELLGDIVPNEFRVPRVVTSDPDTAQRFFDETIAAGHEGVMVKSLETPYEAGRRGSGWLKVKPVRTLDLVVLAVEWGSGRRKGWLSNIHLGARSADGFVMVGKTFKGMTDAILEWQTKRFLELETRRDGHVVYVRPEQVVEVALDGVQRSSRYPGGVALRFARVRGYREDKTPDETDTIETVQAMLT